MQGIGGHQSANMKTDEWLTPPAIIKSLGSFDLDPCAPVNRPWNTALKHYTMLDNGLKHEWFGRIWCNPPYGLQSSKWLSRMSLHGNGIALIFARTETKMFFEWVWNKADSLLFIEGRLFFHYTDGSTARANAGAPSVLVAYGDSNVDSLAYSGIKGKHIHLTSLPMIVIGISPSWKCVINIALTRIGREAHLNRVYDMVEIIAPDKIKKNKFFKEKVRQQLQQHFKKVAKGTYVIDLD